VSSFLLLHGAFRGGWAWDRVVPLLRAAGHEVLAPSLRGCGELFEESQRGSVVSLRDWSDDAVAALPADGPVILVGHSQGGVVAMAVAAVAAERVAHLVLLDSPVPSVGQCAADVVPAEVTAGYGPPPSPATWVDPVPLGRDDAMGLTADLVAWANPLLTPSPAGPAYDPLPAGPAVPRTVVFFDRTPGYYPCAYTRAAMDAAGAPYLTLDAGHDAPLTHPVELADLLLASVASS
jgi:pimeloyl-ACP methyl ester carboxylesterase